MYRLTFYSDSIQTNKDGWIIDDIVLWDNWESVEDNEVNHQIIKAYPNPSSNGLVSLSFQNTGNFTDMELKCYDVFGIEVYSEKVYQYQAETNINIEGWNCGLYVAIVIDGNKIVGQTKFLIN